MQGGELVDRIEKAIAEKGIYAGKTVGNSMNPMLVEGRDTVLIKKAEFPLKKNDIPVYRRLNHYTMHRIIKVTKDGKYIINGDNRPDLERDITDKDIVGVLAAFYHNGEYIECGSEKDLYYAKRARRTYPIRFAKSIFRRLKAKIKKIFKKQ